MTHDTVAISKADDGPFYIWLVCWGGGGSTKKKMITAKPCTTTAWN